VVAVSTRLWLVRHGATEWSDAGRLNGWTDISLNEVGRRQSERLRLHLGPIDFDGIWSSDLARATETARLAVGRAVPDPRLRELDFGDLEGRTWAECPQAMQKELLAFDGFVAPRGESVRRLKDRVFHFAGTLSRGDHLVFTHGGVIRVLSRGADRDVHVEPGGLVRVTGDASGVFTPDKPGDFG
jgi:2,3-bisphosphoglycerate-dependent phosphoglycerate mutase